ncbi:MAG: hypothetical protein SF182_20480 [Deltaproteobacteria bacterium]|nr:hypothetical protein [Deltaproteobacteria bacterium]
MDHKTGGQTAETLWWTEHLTNIDILARKLGELHAAFDDVWQSRGAPSGAALFFRADDDEGCDVFFSPDAAKLLPASWTRLRTTCPPPRLEDVRLLVGHETAYALLREQE